MGNITTWYKPKDNVDQICQDIKDLYNKKENYILSLESELRTLKDEKWKDKEVHRLKEENERLRQANLNGFPISENQHKLILEWMDQHYTNRHQAPAGSKRRIGMQGVSGGLFTYIFLPTAIGTSGVCRCNQCYNEVLRLVGQPQDYSAHHFYYEALENTIKQLDAEFEFQQIG